MNNNLPEYQRTIDRRGLSEYDYFLSLMNAAISRDMITVEEELKIKQGCGELLAFRVKQYTEGQSSSVPSEIAREILNSVYYLIGLGLKKFSEPDAAVEFLVASGVNAAYTEGVSRQRELLLKAKKVYQTLNSAFVGYGCIYYEGTVRKSLAGFFKKYIPDNHRLMAADTVITADYATYLSTKAVTGIEFIKNYIEQLYCENAFCSAFSESAVKALLRSYDNHYEHVLFNVFELVYTRAIGRIICGEEPLSLEPVDSYHDRLNEVFIGKSKSEATAIISEALKSLHSFVQLSPACAKYTEVCAPQAASSVVTAVKLGALKRIFF